MSGEIHTPPRRRLVTETPMMAQYMRAKSEHPDALLLFRMGDFYETFFEDAELLSRATGITLTSRNAGDPEPIPLAGFPWHSAEGHIAKLLQAGHRVAICEQVEEPGPGKKLLERRVVEVLTPGTAIGDSQLEAGVNNFVVALLQHEGRVGLAAADVSTGELLLGEFDPEEARQELIRLDPSEVVTGKEQTDIFAPWLQSLERRPFQTWLDGWRFAHERGRRALCEHLAVATLDGYECEELGPALGAAGGLLEYVREQKQSALGHLRQLRRLRIDDGLLLDETTLRSLELLEPMPGGSRDSTLVSTLDATVTSAGGRHLRACLRRPLTDRSRIEQRLDVVEGLLDSAPRERLRTCLKATADLERILARLHCGRAQPRDLGGLRSTLRQLPRLLELETDLTARIELRPVPPLPASTGMIGESERHSEREPIDSIALAPLAQMLDHALSDDLPITLAEGGVFRAEWNEDLAELRSLARDAKGWIAHLQETERARTGIPNLKVGFNRVFGYYLEVTRTHLEKVPDDYQRKQTLAGAERYLTPELKEFEQKVLTAEEEATRRERRLFEELQEQIRGYTPALQRLAQQLAELDLVQSLAEVAARHRYVRPTLVLEPRLRLVDARHPVVESALGKDRFIPNDAMLDREGHQLAILTGPNMAGKSTYLRQVGIVVIMAQIGSFVPAAEAEIGIADRVFTRVGAHDSLARGQSTFLLEMVETSRILHHASERSLVLLDEVGRGTSTYDGLSIAWAVAERLSLLGTARPRTIFATHFHELTRLADEVAGVFNLHVQVKEWGDRIVFVRKVREGGADRSYGIQVARLAGVPDAVIARAQEVLALLEAEGRRTRTRLPGRAAQPQLSLFDSGSTPEEREVLRALREIEIDRISPLEALTLLDRWRLRLREVRASDSTSNGSP